ncbi:hypothetical protein [Parabacteroides sp. PF5-9]|uniref:hypothetical protein n=1 Tax=Parabacteroides sp. PF5-9 TaxID=1742404 RepID=UPI002473D7FC|nr:hypothetical protein [Parabacteroides sp. PF5-9]
MRNVGTAINVASKDVTHPLTRAEAELLGNHLRWLLSQDVDVKEFNVLIQGQPYVITRENAYDMFIPLKRMFNV